MEAIREWVRRTDIPLRVLGEMMGYPPESAAQNVYAFLKSNPPLKTLCRFADAIGAELTLKLPRRKPEFERNPAGRKKHTPPR